MPKLRFVGSLMDLCQKRISSIVKAHIVTFTEHLVNKWWDEKIKHMEKKKSEQTLIFCRKKNHLDIMLVPMPIFISFSHESLLNPFLTYKISSAGSIGGILIMNYGYKINKTIIWNYMT